MQTLNLYAGISSRGIDILSSTANATLTLNLNNYFLFQPIYLYFDINVAKTFLKMICENQG